MSDVSFELEAIYTNIGVFKHPKVFQCDNRSDLKIDVAMLLKKQNADTRKTTAEYRHTQTDFWKLLTKNW